MGPHHPECPDRLDAIYDAMIATGLDAHVTHLEAPSATLEQLARGLTAKFLHAPTQALNQAGDAERAELVAMFAKIYEIPDGD